MVTAPKRLKRLETSLVSIDKGQKGESKEPTLIHEEN